MDGDKVLDTPLIDGMLFRLITACLTREFTKTFGRRRYLSVRSRARTRSFIVLIARSTSGTCSFAEHMFIVGISTSLATQEKALSA